jgi:hypothetical protein
MSQLRSALAAIGLAAAAVSALPTHAQDAQSECVARRIRLVAKYHSCRANAAARALRDGGAPDIGRCDALLTRVWALVDTQGDGACPQQGTAIIQDQVSSDVDDLVRLLTPPPPACGPFPACNGLCPAGLTCAVHADGCGCLPAVTTPCVDTGGGPGLPVCGGACPTGEACTVINTDVSSLETSCACLAQEALPCVNAAAPTCGGECPVGLTCSPSTGWPCACQ